ncbi:MAG: proline hydroxylase [Kangiella sp.]|nr:MAG: proline hydroxylase [Kangiella sp.]
MNVFFNSSLDFNKISTSYAIDKRVQIQNVWDLETANSIRHCLANEVEYVYAYTSKGKNFEATEQQLKSLSNADMNRFTKELHEDASQGIGFVYGRQLIKLENLAQPSLLHAVCRYLNSDFLLQKIRDISGFEDISLASAKATRYIPGHFLTRHNDLNAKENRRLAYVLNFTPQWHPDWGGLLQFYQKNGLPRDAWAPVFNSMSLFDVNHIHAVTYIAPYAQTPRYAITGFFRVD